MDASACDSACEDSGRPVPPATDAGSCDPGRVRPAGLGRGMGCSSDADCTEGLNGRCYPCETEDLCSYDDCFTDADCTGDMRCVCGVGNLGANRCLSPLDDCGGRASTTSYAYWYGIYPSGLACLTTRDTCRSDSACTGGAVCTRGPVDDELLPFFQCVLFDGPTCR